MSIVLFALIGAAIEAGLAYWICFGAYCTVKATIFIAKIINVTKEDER